MLNQDKPAFLVTVICVTRNAALHLPKLLDSVRQVKTPQVEFIIIDGNSTDDTVNLIKANTDIVDFWLSEPDKGIYDAMNKAVGYTNGKWLYFIGADDALLEGFARMLPLLTKPDTIYYGGVIYRDKPLSKKYTTYGLTKMNICHQAIFYPKAVFDKYRYDTRYVIWADFHLNIRCWHDRRFKFEYHDIIITHYARGGYSETAVDAAYERDKLSMYRQYLGLYPYYRYIKKQVGTWGMIKKLIGAK